MARALAGPRSCISNGFPPPIFQALMDYTLHGQLFLHTPLPLRRGRLRIARLVSAFLINFLR